MGTTIDRSPRTTSYELSLFEGLFFVALKSLIELRVVALGLLLQV